MTDINNLLQHNYSTSHCYNNDLTPDIAREEICFCDIKIVCSSPPQHDEYHHQRLDSSQGRDCCLQSFQ